MLTVRLLISDDINVISRKINGNPVIAELYLSELLSVLLVRLAFRILRLY